ncbi:MAG: ArsR/SmtB family transcription factor [Candidatus Asgardarchaeia archaeon]
MSDTLIVNDEVVVKIAKALASETRWAILKILQKEQKDVSGIAKELKQTEANISAQIKILEDAGLVRSHYEPGDHGVRKVCEGTVKKIIIDISKES